MDEVSTTRFKLRNLTQSDDLRNYISWMTNVNDFPFIESVRLNYTTAELWEYLNKVNKSDDMLQLAIFEKRQNIHIGNLKFHDICFTKFSCYVGFLIGDTEWQNRGVARECFYAVSDRLRRELGIKTFQLGVKQNHLQAIKSYLKMGFKVCETREDGYLMQLDLTS